MIIYLDKPTEGELAFKRLTFPDGQAHCEFDPATLTKAARNGEIALIGAIKSGNDVLNIALALDAVRSAFSPPYPAITLNISYLLGARMDRRIAEGQPATLAVITQLLNACTAGLTSVRVLDPHSPVTLASLSLPPGREGQVVQDDPRCRRHVQGVEAGGHGNGHRRGPRQHRGRQTGPLGPQQHGGL